jgi:hypothetical protein
MNRTTSIALASAAILIAILVGFLSFGRKSPPATSVVPAGPNALETKDGEETVPYASP